MKTSNYSNTSGFLRDSFSSLIKITTFLCVFHFSLQAADSGAYSGPNGKDISEYCSGENCTINENVNDGIDVKEDKHYTSITNNATITPQISEDYDAFDIEDGATIDTFTNNGNINGFIRMGNTHTKITTLTNNGKISGIMRYFGGGEIGLLNNYGYIYLVNKPINENSGSSGGKYVTFAGNDSTKNNNTKSAFDIKVTLGTYHLHINQDSNTFNNFSGYDTWSDDTSHLVIQTKNGDKTSNGSVTINKDSKFVLNIGDDFSVNKDYSMDKLITSEDGTKYELTYKGGGESVTDLYSHLALATSSPTYTLSKSGDNSFIIKLNTESSIGNTIYKGNIQSMNGLLSQIHTFFSSSMGGGSYVLAFNDSSQNMQDFREYERFYYKNENDNLRLQLSATGANNRTRIQNENLNNHFFFSPFVSRNIFKENDGFGFSGVNYGFISGFSFDLDSANTLGIHTAFSYGNLNGKQGTSQTNIDTMSTALGLHYKLDMGYGLYMKVFGDVFYIQNKVLLDTQEQSPDSTGFSGNIYFGKNVDFNGAGILSFELGGSYQGLQNNEINFINETYAKKLISLVYGEVYANYHKSFDDIGINAGVGAKYLFTKPTARILIDGYRDFDIGVDRILGIVRLGMDWYINEIASFNLDYIGSFGDKSISNSGMFNVRLSW